MEIFKLFGSIFLQDTEAQKSLDNIDKKAKGTSVSLGSIVGTAAKVGVGVAAGVAAGATALFGMAKNAADVTSNIKDAADRAGTTAEEFQKFKYAAEMSGMSVESLEKAMIKQQKAFADANEGSKVQSEAYQRLGIDIKKVGSSSEAFDLVIARLADMENETEKNALANDIFGKSYADLTPLFNEGSAGIDELKQKAVNLGLVMSNDAVDAGEAFGDNLETLQQSFGMITTKIGIEVMPIMQKAVDWVLEHMPQIQSVVGTVFDVVGKVVTTAGEIIQNYLLPALDSIWNWVQPYLPQIQAFFQDVFDAVGLVLKGFIKVIGDVINWVKQWFKDNQDTVNSVKELFKAVFEYLKTYITTFITVVQDLWAKYGDDIQRIAKTAWDYVSSIIETAIDIITGIIKVFTAVLKGDWSGALDAIKQTAGKVWEDIKNVFDKYINMAKSIVNLGLDVIKNAFGKTFGGIKETVGGIFEGIVTNIKNSINSVLSVLNSVISKINKIKIKIPSVDIPGLGTVGGKEIGFPKINEIPMLAKGGTITEAGSAIVGEAGAELLDLPKGAKVTPLSDSQKAAAGGITLNFYDTKIISDRDIDLLGDKLVKRLKLVGAI